MKPSANDSGTPPRGGSSSRRRLPRTSLSELLHFQYQQQQHRQHDPAQERVDPNQNVCFLPLLNRSTHGGETEAEQHQLLISVLEAALAITGTGGVCSMSPNQEQESSPKDDEDHCTGSKPTFHDDTTTKKYPREDKKKDEEHEQQE